MSHTQHDAKNTAEGLEVISEVQRTPKTASSERMLPYKTTSDSLRKELYDKCTCKTDEEVQQVDKAIKAEELERLLNEKEAALRAEYDKILEKEMATMKERFDFILANEQTRASHLLREAHRERQEKINVLQSQLQCKNLAALMYVMCTEKKRSKLEKLRIIRDYSDYINLLQDILTEGQELILHLSRGYKTAARVDYEWREKMKKVVGEFMAFIYNFAGGSPETNQYLFDLPKLLQTETPIEVNPSENPCDNDDEPVQEILRPKKWYEQLDDDRRPFVVFGDMAEFSPSERREVIKTLKATKTAPKKWRNYVFNDTYFKATCPNIKDIKDLYLERLPTPSKWECEYNIDALMSGLNDLKGKTASKQSLNMGYRRLCQSIDTRGNMGSLLRIVTSANTAPVAPKTDILGARDSMEITSTTKLRERAQSMRPEAAAAIKVPETTPVLSIGKKRASIFEGGHTEIRAQDFDADKLQPIIHKLEPIPVLEPAVEQELKPSTSLLGSLHIDSKHIIPTHVPDVDHHINYERVCPMEKCQRLQVNSFIRSLPPYMRANPFTHFEETFDQYETCSPEQLEILKQRIEAKKMKEAEEREAGLESPMKEWTNRGVAVQTSNLSLSALPPCTCHEPSPTPVSSNFVLDFHDLMPVKQAMDAIQQELMFDNRIEFDRFKLVGQDDEERLSGESKKDFKQIRLQEIKKILQQHPSLLDIFQANAR